MPLCKSGVSVCKIVLDRQNSSLLFLNRRVFVPFRSVNYSRDTLVLPMYKKDLHSLTWPKEWLQIKAKVRKDQMKLAALVSVNNNIYEPGIFSLQRKLALTAHFRLLAVYEVTTNSSSKIPGIDGQILEDEDSKIVTMELLKEIILRPLSYKVKPVNRVIIHKNNVKMRPSCIPTIRDRCLQSLIKLVLEPIVESSSDIHSYGYRPFRSAKQALGLVRKNLGSDPSDYGKYVLDGEIKGFFNNISHHPQ